jgi:hypothetical protein
MGSGVGILHQPPPPVLYRNKIKFKGGGWCKIFLVLFNYLSVFFSTSHPVHVTGGPGVSILSVPFPIAYAHPLKDLWRNIADHFAEGAALVIMEGLDVLINEEKVRRWLQS